MRFNVYMGNFAATLFLLNTVEASYSMNELSGGVLTNGETEATALVDADKSKKSKTSRKKTGKSSAPP